MHSTISQWIARSNSILSNVFQPVKFIMNLHHKSVRQKDVPYFISELQSMDYGLKTNLIYCGMNCEPERQMFKIKTNHYNQELN